MALTWARQDRPVWDEDKRRVVGGAPEGALDEVHADGEDLPGDWFAATDEQGRVVGFGWMDSTWGGDTEILLAVAPDAEGGGVGSFVLSSLEQEAARRGMNYVYNTVLPTHPQRDEVSDWLRVRGYEGNERDDSLRKRVVLGEPAPTTTRPYAGGETAGDRAAMPPGREDSGGYVDVEDHRY